MAVYITRHARNRMRLWHLTEADVMRILTQPDRVKPSRRGRQHAWQQTARGWLRVTYAEEGETRVVVTVTAIDMDQRRYKRAYHL